jgi:hypothetical protein
MDKEGKDVGVVAGDIVAYSKPDELPKDITMHKVHHCFLVFFHLYAFLP